MDDQAIDRRNASDASDYETALAQAMAALEHKRELARARSKKYREKNGDAHKESARKWRADHPDKHKAAQRGWRNKPSVRARQREENDRFYLSRPFITIDSEGQNYNGNDIVYGDVLYKEHGTYIWAACPSQRLLSINQGVLTTEPQYLVDPRTNGTTKHKLGAETILDWLLSLPRIYGTYTNKKKEKAIPHFMMFGMSYDVAQMLSQMDLPTAHAIYKRKNYDDDEPITAPEFWKGYALSYVKGKWLDIWRLKNPDEPYLCHHGIPVEDRNGRKTLLFSEHIRIYEAFGYFQTSFAEVVDDMLKQGYATLEEKKRISRMKAARGQFAEHDIEAIKEYTTTECRLLSLQMEMLRQAFFDIGLKLNSWHGPGAAATKMIENKGVHAHYGEHVSASNISPQQEWATYTFFGARIETMMQGYLKSGSLYVYDIASAYPYALTRLPSLASFAGEWKYVDGGELTYSSLSQLRALIEAALPVSMYQVRWRFPKYDRKAKPPKHLSADEQARRIEQNSLHIPFYPLPYRTKTGAILFAAKGYARVMQDDMLAAVSWLERFAPSFPGRDVKDGEPVSLIIEGAWIWSVKPEMENFHPFSFLYDLYEKRRAIKDASARTGVYNILEKVLKLVINSMYGKTAQFIGTAGKVPKTANPFYAAATTAYCRRAVLEAGLIDPHSIVFFATDGIVSTSPLHGEHLGDTSLPRARVGDEKVCLGDWEFADGDGGIFVQSGVYCYWKTSIDEEGKEQKKEVSKLRGANIKNYKLGKSGQPFLVEKTLEAWNTPYNVMDSKTHPCIEETYKKFLTIGSALTPHRWKLAGRWTPEPDEDHAFVRTIRVGMPGGKRKVNILRFGQLISVDGRPPSRTYELIATLPKENGEGEMSRPRPPDWLCEEVGDAVLDDQDEVEAAMGAL
jgi:hypothetical protein